MLMAGLLLSDNRALVGRCGVGDGGGTRGRRASRMLERGLWEIALPGAPPLLGQLGKFIAIDFVISSLSIGSTWAH